MRALFALLAIVAVPADAAVIASGDQGIVIEHRLAIDASPDDVWRLLVAPAGWWSGSHSFSGDAANLSLDPRPGGCFCERLAGGGGVEHARVIHVAPGKLLRLSGALGPLQQDAVTATLSWTLAPAGTGADLTLTMVASGYSRSGLTRIAPAVDGVLGEQATRLKAAAERR